MSYTIMTPSYVNGALQTMLFSNDQLEDAQLRLSTNLRVADAKDNAGYWSTANAMSSDQAIMESVGNALNLSESTIDTAYTALETVLDQLSEIRSALVTASDPSADRASVNTAIESARKAIQVAVESARFSGTNWLQNTSPTLNGTNSFVSSFQRAANGAVTLTTQGVAAADTVLIDTQDASRGLLTGVVDASTLNSTGSTAARNYYLLDVGSTAGVTGTQIGLSDATTEEEIADMIYVVEALKVSVTKVSSRLGDMLNRVTTQKEFAKALGETIDTAIGRLIDYDAEDLSVLHTAAKTQAQLAAEAVNIANTNVQKLLLLFG